MAITEQLQPRKTEGQIPELIKNPEFPSLSQRAVMNSAITTPRLLLLMQMALNRHQVILLKNISVTMNNLQLLPVQQLFQQTAQGIFPAENIPDIDKTSLNEDGWLIKDTRYARSGKKIPSFYSINVASLLINSIETSA